MVCGRSQETVAPGCNREDSVMKRDLYAEVSTRIVAELERGAAPWIKPWSATAGMNTPCNALTNRPYSGSNVVLLWMAQTAGYRTPRFLTFKQALDLGGNVRKGEHGTKVYFVKQLQVADRNGEEGETRIVPMMREYTVFNVDQCEGLLLYVFDCWTNPSLFQTGWFVESLLTQTLIIHIIRSAKLPFLQSRAT